MMSGPEDFQYFVAIFLLLYTFWNSHNTVFQKPKQMHIFTIHTSLVKLVWGGEPPPPVRGGDEFCEIEFKAIINCTRIGWVIDLAVQHLKSFPISVGNIRNYNYFIILYRKSMSEFILHWKQIYSKRISAVNNGDIRGNSSAGSSQLGLVAQVFEIGT